MSEPQTITVRDLIRQIDAALLVMSQHNPHRTLLVRCGRALVELAVRAQVPPTEPVLQKVEETVQ